MVHRHRMDRRQRAIEDTALDDAARKPAGNGEITLRISDQVIEWTDDDRARWQQAHEPWWKPLSD